MNQHQHHAAVAELFECHHDLIVRICSSFLCDPDLARDAAQDVFTAAVEAHQAGANINLAWLRIVARNISLDLRHARQKEPDQLSDLATSEIAFDPTYALRYDAIDPAPAMILKIRAGMQKLPEIYRDVLDRRHIRGQRLAEIAIETGLPIGTVKRRLSTARDLLRARLVSR